MYSVTDMGDKLYLYCTPDDIDRWDGSTPEITYAVGTSMAIAHFRVRGDKMVCELANHVAKFYGKLGLGLCQRKMGANTYEYVLQRVGKEYRRDAL
jgi:hypothetical protein